jgi:hypothetical protein
MPKRWQAYRKLIEYIVSATSDPSASVASVNFQTEGSTQIACYLNAIINSFAVLPLGTSEKKILRKGGASLKIIQGYFVIRQNTGCCKHLLTFPSKELSYDSKSGFHQSEVSSTSYISALQ